MNIASSSNDLSEIPKDIQEPRSIIDEPSTSSQTEDRTDTNLSGNQSLDNKSRETKSAHLDSKSSGSPSNSVSSECEHLSEKEDEKKVFRKINYYLTEIIHHFDDSENSENNDLPKMSGNKNTAETNPCTSHNNHTSNTENPEEDDEIILSKTTNDNIPAETHKK